MSGSFGGARKTLLVVLFTIASRSKFYGQVPCPVALITARAEKESIQLEFMNKGKVPIEELSLACSPSAKNESPKGTCHIESGIFYPSTVSWMKIDYPGANRHTVEVSVKDLRLAGGILWQSRPSYKCKILQVRPKR